MGLSLKQALDMSWSEFVLKSHALKREREREELLFREVAYQVFSLNYMFDKKRPPKKDKFWQIGEVEAMSKEQRKIVQAALIRGEEAFKSQVNGKVND